MGFALGDDELLIEQSHMCTMQVVTYIEGWTLQRDDFVHSMKHRIALRGELIEICQDSFGQEQYRQRKAFLESTRSSEPAKSWSEIHSNNNRGRW
jgi:hypothetical protein